MKLKDIFAQKQPEKDVLHGQTPNTLQPNAEKIAITEHELAEAYKVLQKYKSGKTNLENKIISNENFWKLRQWNNIGGVKDNDFKPASAWLWSCIVSKHSDVMDAYPAPNLLPRMDDDKDEAKKLSDIMPVVLEQNNFENVYSDVAWYTLKHGGGVYGVFWDGSKLNGLGDITIKKVDFLNLFWEPGITDIQRSANVFHVDFVDNKTLESRYPNLKGKLSGKKITTAKYIHDDYIDTSDKSAVIDWYYHRNYNGRNILHYCKFVNNEVLFATENNQQQYPEGWYQHGLYPFVIQEMYPVEGSLCGYGITDIGKDTQIQIDLMNQAILKNALAACRRRWFIRSDGEVNEAEYADWEKDFVHTNGASLGDDSLREIATNPLNGIYLTVLNAKIDELKECTSNRDVNNGTAPSGITAASAIAALQEQGGKNSRMLIKSMYFAYKGVINQCIELIRQFYNVPRQFRILGESGMGEQFIQYSNAGIMPQNQGDVMGQDLGMRLPVFDINVTAEKANPYKKMEQNELALQFFNLGFFNPQMSDQALACLETMDFDRKEELIDRISQNGTLMDMLLQYQQIALQLAKRCDPAMADMLAQQIMGSAQGAQIPGMPIEAVSISPQTKEDSRVEKAREQSRTSSQPQ